MDNSLNVLSIIEAYIGHKTYGNLMRTYFNQSPSCHVDFYWYNDERELPTRVINRLLSYSSDNPWIQAQNIDFHVFRFQLGFGYMAKRLALRKLQQAKYSLLHFHTQPLAYLSIDLMKKLPTIISIDRTIAQASRDKTDPRFRWTYAPNLLLDKQVFEQAAKIIAFSEAARQSVIEDFNIQEQKVSVVYPGVDLSKIPAIDRLTRPAQSRYKILFIGADFERKGGYDLLEVFLEKFAHQAELHLVTRAPIQCEHPNVYIHNQIEAYTPEWLALYHQADVFVMPTYSEPFGWVFIEAMAAGLPIIATDLNAIPEIVVQGKTGFLIQPGDRSALAHSIQTLIEHPDLGHQMGAKGRAIAEQKFDVHKNFQALESLFREVAISY